MTILERRRLLPLTDLCGAVGFDARWLVGACDGRFILEPRRTVLVAQFDGDNQDRRAADVKRALLEVPLVMMWLMWRASGVPPVTTKLEQSSSARCSSSVGRSRDDARMGGSLSFSPPRAAHSAATTWRASAPREVARQNGLEIARTGQGRPRFNYHKNNAKVRSAAAVRAALRATENDNARGRGWGGRWTQTSGQRGAPSASKRARARGCRHARPARDPARRWSGLDLTPRRRCSRGARVVRPAIVPRSVGDDDGRRMNDDDDADRWCCNDDDVMLRRKLGFFEGGGLAVGIRAPHGHYGYIVVVKRRDPHTTCHLYRSGSTRRRAPAGRCGRARSASKWWTPRSARDISLSEASVEKPAWVCFHAQFDLGAPWAGVAVGKICLVELGSRMIAVGLGVATPAEVKSATHDKEVRPGCGFSSH